MQTARWDPGQGGLQGRLSASLPPSSIPWALPGSTNMPPIPPAVSQGPQKGRADGVNSHFRSSSTVPLPPVPLWCHSYQPSLFSPCPDSLVSALGGRPLPSLVCYASLLLFIMANNGLPGTPPEGTEFLTIALQVLTRVFTNPPALQRRKLAGAQGP